MFHSDCENLSTVLKFSYLCRSNELLFNVNNYCAPLGQYIIHKIATPRKHRTQFTTDKHETSYKTLLIWIVSKSSAPVGEIGQNSKWNWKRNTPNILKAHFLWKKNAKTGRFLSHNKEFSHVIGCYVTLDLGALLRNYKLFRIQNYETSSES